MKDSTRLRLIEESNKIYRRFVWYSFVMIAGIMTIIISPTSFYNPIVFSLAVTGFIVALIAICLNILLLSGLNYDDPDPPRPPRPTHSPVRDNPSNILNYQQFNPGTAIIVPSEDKDNVLYKCKWRFEPPEWLRLVRQLSINADGQGRWKWTKSALKKTELFNATMTPDVSIDNSSDYPVICAEFVRLGVIEGRMGKWRVTRPGMVALSRAAKLNVVPGRG
jgi:hypothetical protein